MRRHLCLAAVAAFVLGCSGPPSRGPLLAGLPQPGDAPYELTDDGDLDAQRAVLDTLPPGEARERLRGRLAAEYASRIRRALDRDDRNLSYANFMRLVGLWNVGEIEAGLAAKSLAPRTQLFAEVRALFARAGADHQAAGSLFLLAHIDPTRAVAYRAEIEEIFLYSDTLNVAQYGDGAQRARPIEILEGIAQFFPSREVVDRLVELYVERQRAIAERIRRRGADFDLIRAHGAGVLRTAWKIAALLAKANRLDEARATLDQVTGIGGDPDLEALLRHALRPGSGDQAWLDLAEHFRLAEDEESDLDAMLAVLRHGLTARPKSATLSLAAGNVAVELGQIPLAVKYFEKGLALNHRHRESSERLAALYEARVISLALGARVKAATEQLAVFEDFHARAKRLFDRPIKPDLADAYAAMGHGLASLGDLERSRRYLAQSVRKRPTFAALEMLGTIELKRENHRAALGHFQKALKLPIETEEQHLQYNRILRLAGEAALGQHDIKRAGSYLAQAMKRWEQVLGKYELSDDQLAKLLIETGRIQWLVSERDGAKAAFNAALDAVPDNEEVFSEIVAFLIGRGMYREALDAFHRALGSPDISDETKVYMGLWLVAEAKFTATDVDPFAMELLSQKTGHGWQDALARLARGDATMAELTPLATTHRRQTELLFYDATLREATRNPERARELLQRVVGGNMLLDFEYELARRWLDHRLDKRRRERR